MSIDRFKIKLPPHIRMDCYRTALYPILEYYEADPDLLMILNDAKFVYESELKCETERCYQLNDMFQDFNIKKMAIEVPNDMDILSFLKSKLDNDCFLICFLDVFFYSPFKAVFQRFHTTHGIPIFGYNDDKKVFYAIDSDYMESFERIFIEVPYDEMVKSVVGFYNLKNMPAIHVLYKDTENLVHPLPLNEIRRKYAINFGNMFSSDRYNNYNNEMAEFYNYIFDNASYENEMIDFSRKFYTHIDRFINARMLEYYAMPRIFDDITTLQRIDATIVEKCNFIRAIIYRTNMAKQYRKQSFERFPEYFNIIFEKEKERIAFLKSFCWKKNIKSL